MSEELLKEIDRAVLVYQAKRERKEDVTVSLMDIEEAIFELVHEACK